MNTEAAPDILDKVAWPVSTERLVLRRATLEDARALFEIRRQEPVSRWLGRWVTDYDTWAETHAKPDRMATTLIVELDGRVIGDLMIKVEDAWAQVEVAEQAKGTQAELGWVLDPAYAGKGYATEAVRELLRICFADLGLRRVVAYCFADNEPSWRLMERVGMRRESHTRRDSLHRDRGWLDGLSYGILAEEFEG